MVINDKIICPRCEVEKKDRELQHSIQQEFELIEQKRKYNIFYKQSILSDETVLEADIRKLKSESDEDGANTEIALDVLERYKKGEVFNTIFQGNQGAGKSFTAYAMAKEFNETGEHSCLFVSVEEMIRLIKDSFSNKESKYTENYFVELLSSVDLLVMDDIGAETGAIDSKKAASDFVHRVLYGISNARQNKQTIITMNLDSETLFKMYDKKLVSRLMRKPKYIVYKNTKDKRMAKLPF